MTYMKAYIFVFGGGRQRKEKKEKTKGGGGPKKFYQPLCRLKWGEKLLVLLSALVDRFGVSRMLDFFQMNEIAHLLY